MSLFVVLRRFKNLGKNEFCDKKDGIGIDESES